MMRQKFRSDIYENYASEFNGATGDVSISQFKRSWSGYDYLFRSWLPSHQGSEVVDLGCGSGGVLHYLSEGKGIKNVFGVDISKSQVDLAKQHAKNIELGDALEYLRNTDRKFDLIIALDLIEHLTKDEVLEFLKLCHHRLASGGRIILQTPNAASPFFGTVRYGDFTHEVAFTPDLLEKLLKRVGFEGIESRESGPIPFGYSFASTVRSAMWQLLRKGISFMHLIETGGSGHGVHTRVFLQSGVKK